MVQRLYVLYDFDGLIYLPSFDGTFQAKFDSAGFYVVAPFRINMFWFLFLYERMFRVSKFT